MKYHVLLMPAILLLSTPGWAQLLERTPADTARGSGAVYSYAEQMPVFPGGQAALFQALSETVQYPAEALQQRIEGKVFVSFIVSASGKVLEAAATKEAHPLLAAEAVRAVSNLPAFTPGRQAGRAVPVRFALPISFKLPTNLHQLIANRAAAVNSQLEVVKPADFPGGPDALRTYLAAVPYPEAARTRQSAGRVFVELEISPQGKIEKAKAIVPKDKDQKQRTETGSSPLLATDPLLLKAAERWVAAMPAWTPATYEGAVLPSSLTVMLDFHLTPTATPPSPIYAYAEQPPVFVGVTPELPLIVLLQKTVRYPAAALRSRTQGQVVVYFVVNEAGTVEQAAVIRSAHPILDTEVVRAVNTLQATTPAMQGGKPVKVFYIFPADFSIR